jgi:hypothetical protein
MKENVLQRAGHLVDGDRRRDYSHPLSNHIDIAIRRSLRRISEGFVTSPYDVVWDMADLKIARDSFTSKQDNQDDTVGYMTCLDRMQSKVIEMGLASNIEEANKILRTRDLVFMTQLLVDFHIHEQSKKHNSNKSLM